MTGDKGKVDNDFWYKDVKELLGTLMPDRKEYISIYGRLLVCLLSHYHNKLPSQGQLLRSES